MDAEILEVFAEIDALPEPARTEALRRAWWAVCRCLALDSLSQAVVGLRLSTAQEADNAHSGN